MSPNYGTDFSGFLRHIGDELDAPPEVHRRLKAEYTRIGEFIREDSPTRFSADAEVYPQGSKALGTLVRPVDPKADFDLDAVYRRDVKKESVTREELKRTTGEQLAAFVEVRKREIAGRLELKDGRRCWTLQYDGFHIDILPAVPDPVRAAAGVRGEPISITDRRLWNWQASNPRGFIEWFRTRMTMARRALREDTLKKHAEVTVHEVADDEAKTPLQVAVQLLKRHRDLYFAGRPEDRPISVIITTLATQAYQGELDPAEALIGITRDAPRHIEHRDGKFLVVNPVDPAENFADKWNEDPRLAETFVAWLGKARADFAGAQSEPGFDKIAKSLGGVLGESVIRGAAERRDSAMRAQSQGGRLRAARGSAGLGDTGTIPVPKHTFYGDPDDS